MRQKEVWLFVFMVGLLAFNWPMLAIFSSVLPAYIFAAWLAVIAVIAFFSVRTSKEEDGG